MVSFDITIVPALALKNGRHTIRIAVKHNGKTKYIPTNVVIDDVSQFKDGKIIKRADKEILNLKLRKELKKYEDRCDNISYIDGLTCQQLVDIIRNDHSPRELRTFKAVSEEYLSQIDGTERAKTKKLYTLAVNRFLSYSGQSAMLQEITPVRVNGYLNFLAKGGLSQTTVNIYYTLFKVIVNYAVKLHYVKYDVSPFVTARVPHAQKRETQVTVDELRTIRDTDFGKYNMNTIRDIFMLTYYLAGMNLVDMLAYNFKGKDEICYVRRKTRNTKEGENCIKFTIPDEAKPIIRKYMNRSGKLVFGRYSTYVSCYNVLARKMKKIGEAVGIDHDFTLYSARKSFVQHGFDLGIPLSTLEYCIGQSMKEDRPIFNYVSIMQKHADNAIRTILNNLKK